jgi:hypothetical protein
LSFLQIFKILVCCCITWLLLFSIFNSKSFWLSMPFFAILIADIILGLLLSITCNVILIKEKDGYIMIYNYPFYDIHQHIYITCIVCSSAYQGILTLFSSCITNLHIWHIRTWIQGSWTYLLIVTVQFSSVVCILPLILLN